MLSLMCGTPASLDSFSSTDVRLSTFDSAERTTVASTQPSSASKPAAIRFGINNNTILTILANGTEIASSFKKLNAAAIPMIKTNQKTIRDNKCAKS